MDHELEEPIAPRISVSDSAEPNESIEPPAPAIQIVEKIVTIDFDNRSEVMSKELREVLVKRYLTKIHGSEWWSGYDNRLRYVEEEMVEHLLQIGVKEATEDDSKKLDDD